MDKIKDTLKSLLIAILIIGAFMLMYFFGGSNSSNGYYAADPTDINGDGFYYIWVEE